MPGYGGQRFCTERAGLRLLPPKSAIQSLAKRVTHGL
jgi:hypothetical protein